MIQCLGYLSPTVPTERIAALSHHLLQYSGLILGPLPVIATFSSTISACVSWLASVLPVRFRGLWHSYTVALGSITASSVMLGSSTTSCGSLESFIRIAS